MARLKYGAKRGGLHLKVARAIDTGFAGGEFDLPSWQQWAVDQVYEYPAADVRKALADEFVAADGDTDIQESLLYTSAAFDYMIWNRAVQTTWSERQVIFAELAGAAGDDVDDDA